MRFDFTKTGSGLTYEIRNIVEIGNKLISYGRDVRWENIGDPIMKGEKLPGWLKEALKKVLDDDTTFMYSPTKGFDKTREYIAAKTNALGGAKITKDNILFFNGVGDAVAHTYAALQVEARVIMPSPTYSTHFMSEVLHASYPPNTYSSDPANNWMPNLKELEDKVKYRDSIVGILVINPDNPTGFVYPEHMLREIVRIAKENNTFLIFDEIYNRITYKGFKTPLLAEIIGDVPGVSMSSVSKEVPWPGARCGWMQIFNSGKDGAFDRFINSIVHQKMSEVCSTSFPQAALPIIYEHPEFQGYLDERVAHYERLADIAVEIMGGCKYLNVVRPNGAFYFSPTFKEGVLNSKQTLPVEPAAVREFIESKLTDKTEMDKRFAYYLIAHCGVCVVPLTSFFTSINGFRMVLLEKDVDLFRATCEKIRKAVDDYVESSN